MTYSSKIRQFERILQPRGLSRLKRQVNRDIGRIHKNRTILKHFENRPETRPGGEYNYAKREREYQINKARVKGHQRPLVFSGETRQIVLANLKLTATQKGWRLRARPMANHPLKPNLRRQFERELAAIGDSEIDKYESLMTKRFLILLEKNPQFLLRRIRRNKGK